MMSAFPIVMVTVPVTAADQDPASEGVGAWVRSVVTAHGYRLTDDAATADVVVGTDPSMADPSARTQGLVLIGTDWPAPIRDLLTALGITPDPARVDGTVAAAALGDQAPRGVDLLARVDPATLTATGALAVHTPAFPLLSAAGAPVAAATEDGDRRLVVLAVRPVTGPSADELLFNAITFAAGRSAGARPASGSGSGSGSNLAQHPAWLRLKAAVTDLQSLQAADGSIPDAGTHAGARTSVGAIVDAVVELAPRFPHDTDYLAALVKDLTRWQDGGFAVPDFLDSLVAFHPERARTDGRAHLVVFPMYTQNGSPDRHVEAVLVQVIWPDFIADLESGEYANKLFVPIRFLDFTAGYDTNSAVLFPETVAMREIPKFTWGAIFADREAARFRRVVAAAAEITGLALPPDAARLLVDQRLTEETFVMWDLIHDRTHMHGDLPFDPFMIKQRMPYFLYSLEELRCDLTAFRESVALEQQGVPHARLVQYAILFDRIFRFPITGTRVRNYDGLGGQLLFAWLHRHGVLHWTDNRLTVEWDRVAEHVLELGRRIEDLYWRSIDRPKVNHWLAAYRLVSETLEPHPASIWARGVDALPVDGPPKGLTDAVLPDEFPLSMFYEALSRKLSPVIASTKGITG
jgi:hypothetical protein